MQLYLSEAHMNTEFINLHLSRADGKGRDWRGEV